MSENLLVGTPETQLCGALHTKSGLIQVLVRDVVQRRLRHVGLRYQNPSASIPSPCTQRRSESIEVTKCWWFVPDMSLLYI